MNRYRSNKQLAAVTLAALATAVLGACGNDGPEEATNTQAASSNEATSNNEGSTAEYITAGNALCDTISADIQAAFPDFEGEPTIPQVQQLGRDLSPVLVRWRDGVADLNPPADRADQHQALLDALERSIAKLDEAAASPEAAQAMRETGGPPLDEPGNAAHALFERCPAGD